MKIKDTVVVVRGAGDLATGTIHMLHMCGFKVAALEIERPTVIRRYAALRKRCFRERQPWKMLLQRKWRRWRI